MSSDAMKNIRLGDVFQVSNERLGDHVEEPPVFAISKYDGVVLGSEYHERRVASDKLNTYKVLGPADWAYSTIHIDEGAIARNNHDFLGVVSPMYTILRWISDEHDPRYFEHLLRSPKMLATYGDMAQGSINRRRSLPWKSFAAISVSVPPLPEQRHIVDLIEAVSGAVDAATEQTQALFAALAEARNSLIWSVDDRRPLSVLCTIDGSLVDPTTQETRLLPHVGAERIMSGSGDLAGVQTAAEDGVTSGKFRFDETHVIYSKIRPLLRKVAVPGFAGLCSADAYPLLPSAGRSRVFLQQLLLSDAFTAEAAARSGRTKMPKVNKSELMTILVPYHSVESEDALTPLLEGLDSARLRSDQLAQSLRALRTELLSALLSGAHRIPETYDELMGA